MAHELTQNANGQHEMMYVGEKPWHGLGQALDKPATAEEALLAANLAWTVSKNELKTKNGIEIPSHRAICRDDNGEPLGVVSKSYGIIQNTEAFAFCDSIIGTGGAYYETAGSLFGGKKIFLTCKLPAEIRVTPDDRIVEYLTLMTGHDGFTPLRAYFTPIRTVCNNTMLLGLRNRRESVTIRHCGKIEDKVQMAKEALGLAGKYFGDFEATAKRLAEIQMQRNDTEKFLNALFATPERKASDAPSPRTQTKMNQVLKNFEESPDNNLPGIKGSAWALLNAATQYADHQSPSVTKPDADRRMNSIMFGTGAEIRRKAYNLITVLVAPSMAPKAIR